MGNLNIILAVMLLCLDFYVFEALKVVAQGISPKWKMVLFGTYWTLSVVIVIVLIIMPFINFDAWPKSFRNYLFATILGVFFAELLVSVFLLMDDVRRLIQWGSSRLFFRHTEGEGLSGEGISRSTFLSWLGLGVGGSLFGTLIYGFSNKYNYDLRRVKLSFANLPESFRGLRIIQISDIHSGSFTDKKAVEKGVEMILREKPDLILFTGDLVNDRAGEMTDYMDIFSRLQAPLGVFSTLGNHDYGDYVHWENAAAKNENLEQVKAIHGKMGWRLLMNEHVALERKGQHIALLGIENWSAKARFPKHGRMGEAYKGSENYPFRILISHDPSH
jgi:predicted phosphodiesterase